MVKIPDGFQLLARQIQDSEIWKTKPAWWLKVWLHIILEVNHKDNKFFKRGENFFSFQEIYDKCTLRNEGIKLRSVDNVVSWLRERKMCTTRKTTRGIVITVVKYEYFQDIDNYRNDTQNDTGTGQERDRNGTINNNDNNDNNTTVTSSGLTPQERPSKLLEVNQEKPVKDNADGVARLLAEFSAKYGMIMGVKYVPTYGEDKKKLKSLLDILPENVIMANIPKYFEFHKQSDYWKKSAPCIRTYAFCINDVMAWKPKVTFGSNKLPDLGR
jgi:hypothetical protein